MSTTAMIIETSTFSFALIFFTMIIYSKDKKNRKIIFVLEKSKKKKESATAWACGKILT